MKTTHNLDDLRKLAARPSAILNDDFLGDLAVSLWRLEKALATEPEDSQARKLLRRLLARLEDKGLRLSEDTGRPYDEGMALRVVSSEERPDLNRNLVIETITPSVFLRDNLIHAGEVVVGKPLTR